MNEIPTLKFLDWCLLDKVVEPCKNSINIKYVVGLRVPPAPILISWILWVWEEKKESKQIETSQHYMHGKGQQCLRFFSSRSINQADFFFRLLFWHLFFTTFSQQQEGNRFFFKAQVIYSKLDLEWIWNYRTSNFPNP